MPRRPSSLASAVDQLTREFVDAILEAVLTASCRELAGDERRVAAPAPTVARRGRAPARAPAPTPRRRPRAQPRAARVDHDEEIFGDTVISDPAAVLAMVASFTSAADEAPARKSEPAPEPEPTPAPAPVVERSRVPVIALRPGDDVLRSRGGGVVLRRRSAS